MGEIVNVRCANCKKTWRCITGNGLAYADSAVIIAAFPEQDREKVEKLLSMSEIPAYDFRYGLAVCAHCHNMVGVSMVGLSADDEPYVGSCPVCGNKVGNLCTEEQDVEAWCEKTACPVCKSRKLEIAEISYWD